jgi:hypothetical protein
MNEWPGDLPPREPLEALRHATARAVAETREIVVWLAAEVEALAGRLLVSPAVLPDADDAELRGLLDADRITAEAVADELRALVACAV